tara:strand:+ start:1839 stop:4520 length:2682 start_codon:yes stop_codon:yes gene_type:complete
MEYKLENYLDRRDNTAKRGLVDGPGGYAGKPRNPELAAENKKKYIKKFGQEQFDKLSGTSKSRVYRGVEGAGEFSKKGRTGQKSNPESVKKMIESKRFKTLDDYGPERKQNILDYFEKTNPEMSINEIEKEFFSYGKQRKNHISGGRLKGAPSDDKTALSRIYKTETIPGYVQELDDEILRLTKEHSNPNKIKSELYKTFNDPKYTQVPEGVEAYNVFFDPKAKRFNFRLSATNNRRKSESFLNQKIAVNMMNSVKGDLNYDTAMAVKKFYLDKGDLTGPEKSAVKKFKRQYGLTAIESGGLGSERKTGKQVVSPWLEYSKNLEFNVGKRLTDFKRFDTQATYLENVIKTLTRPEDVAFFTKELEAVKENQKKLVPAIRKEFPGLLDGIKINNEHKIAKALVDEGTVPLRYLTQTTPTPSFFNAIKYKEFDEPLIELVYKYNDASPKDRPGIKQEIEDLQKNFNNKTKVKGVGYLDSVKFTYGPKGVRAKDTTPTFRKGDFASQLVQNTKHSNAYLKNTGKKSIVVGGMMGKKRYNIDKLIIKPPRNFEVAVQSLGCQGSKVRVKRVEGGKINTKTCYNKGLEKLRNKQITDPIDAKNMMRVAKASTSIARVSGAGRVAAILGPAGIGLDLLFEGAIVGNEYLKGRPFEEAWGESFLSYLGPNRKDPEQLKMDRYAGDDPKAQSYVQDVRMLQEFNKNLELYKTMKNDIYNETYTPEMLQEQFDKTSDIYGMIADKYPIPMNPDGTVNDNKPGPLEQAEANTVGDEARMFATGSDYRAYKEGEERALVKQVEKAKTLPFGEMSPARIETERKKRITDIFGIGQDGRPKLVGQKMKPQVELEGMAKYDQLRRGVIQGIGYMAEGGLANLTRTTPPKRSLNKDSQGLASLPEYDR